MNTYKINKNKSTLSDEQVLKHKDFKQVMDGYKELHNYKHATKPLYKNIKFLGFIVLVCTVSLVLLIVEREEGERKKEAKKEKSTIKPTKATVIVAPVVPAKTTNEITTMAEAQKPKQALKKGAENVIIEKEDSVHSEQLKESKPIPVPKVEEKPKRKVEIGNNGKVLYRKTIDDGNTEENIP